MTRNKSRFAHFIPSRTIRNILIVVVAGFFGIVSLRAISAATFAVASESETGTVTGKAAKIDDSAASGGQAVRFGATMPPMNIQAITGGNSIVLLWDAPAQNVPTYEVYRNDVKVATVEPATDPLRTASGSPRYLDMSVASGQTYRYKVRAITSAGGTSNFSAQVSATHQTRTPVPTVTYDTSAVPEMTAMVRDQLVPTIQTWYPKIADALAGTSYPVFGGPIHIWYDPTFTGTAYVSGGLPAGHIRVNPNYAPTADTAQITMLHEITHMVQGYNASSSQTPWGLESIAEWTPDWFARMRYKVRTAKLSVDILNPDYKYEGSYLPEWGKRYDPDFPRKVNVAIRTGTYNDTFMRNLTGGKTASELYNEMRNQHYSGANTTMPGAGGLCTEVLNASLGNGAKLQLNTCNGTSTQQWRRVYQDAGLNAGLYGNTKSQFYLMNSSIGAPDGKCIDVNGAGTASGTIVHSWQCTLHKVELAQMWTDGPNGSLINPKSGKCLTAREGAVIGSQFIIADCNGSASQRWTAPI